jgi:hypothetical protein
MLEPKRTPRSQVLESARIEKALARAIDEGSMADLFDQLDRNSGLPGPQPNVDLARALGGAIAARRGRADAVLRALLGSPSEYPVIVAAFALASRLLAGVDPRGSMQDLHDLAEDPRHHVRAGVVLALRTLIAAQGEPIINELAAWTDGYLHAHVVLEALADKTLLAGLPSGDAILARLDEAFALADISPRAAERSQGVRALRGGMPAQIAILAARCPEVLGWLADRTRASRPETREVIRETLLALRRAGFRGAEVDRLAAALEASAPPPRDPSRIVHGTRQRGRGSAGRPDPRRKRPH